MIGRFVSLYDRMKILSDRRSVMDGLVHLDELLRKIMWKTECDGVIDSSIWDFKKKYVKI